MKQTFAKIGIGILLVSASGASPIIPSSLTYLYSWEYNVADVPGAIQRGEVPDEIQEVYKEAVDDDNDGIVAISVFSDRKGNLVYQSIPDSKYALMRARDGKLHNPTKTELISLIDLTTPRVEAAIAFDAASGMTTFASPATSGSLSHTISGSDRMLFAGVFFAGSASGLSINYNSTTMTEVAASGGWFFGSGSERTWALQAPDTGTNNINFSWTTGQTVRAIGLSYTGVNQSVTMDATNNGTGSGTSATGSLTSVADNSWQIFMVGIQNGRTVSASTGSTLRTSATQVYAGFDSNGPKTPAGSTSMSASFSSSGAYAWTMVSFAPAAGAPPAAVVQPPQIIQFD